MEFIVNYPDIVVKLITSINVNDNEDQSYDVKCRVATSILLESVLKNRIHKIGLLISTANSVRKYQLKDESDFGERYHTQYSEPYYYDSAYILPDDSNQINKAIPVDAYGKCHIAGKNQTMMTTTMSIKMSNRIKAKNLNHRCLNGYAQIGVSF